MSPIKKILLSAVVMLFNREYSAVAFHDYDKTGSLSCQKYCEQFGEKEAFNAGVGGQFTIAGNFKSCVCFTTTEANAIKTCNAQSCGSYTTGSVRAYILSSNYTTWCSSSLVYAGCACQSGYHQTSTNQYPIICKQDSIPCGYIYVPGSTPKICPPGYYCPTGATAATKCPGSGSFDSKITSSAGSCYASNCYYPKDIQLSDASGQYMFTSNCFYS